MRVVQLRAMQHRHIPYPLLSPCCKRARRSAPCNAVPTHPLFPNPAARATQAASCGRFCNRHSPSQVSKRVIVGKEGVGCSVPGITPLEVALGFERRLILQSRLSSSSRSDLFGSRVFCFISVFFLFLFLGLARVAVFSHPVRWHLACFTLSFAIVFVFVRLTAVCDRTVRAHIVAILSTASL